MIETRAVHGVEVAGMQGSQTCNPGHLPQFFSAGLQRHFAMPLHRKIFLLGRRGCALASQSGNYATLPLAKC